MALIEPVQVSLRHGSACLIRAAEVPDAGALLEHQVRMVATDPFSTRVPGEHIRTLREQEESIAAHRAHPSQLIVIALRDGDPRAPAGEAAPGHGLIGVLRFAAGDRRKTAHAGHFGISVQSDWRGKGLGSALIGVLLEWAAAHAEIEKVCLGVLGGNVRAQALYRRMGFVEEGRSPRHFRFGPGWYEEDIQMALYVKPGVAPEGFLTWRGGGCC